MINMIACVSLVHFQQTSLYVGRVIKKTIYQDSRASPSLWSTRRERSRSRSSYLRWSVTRLRLTLITNDYPLLSMSQPLWQPRTDLAARLLGAGFLVGGGALFGYQVNVIIRAVATHAEQVDYFMSAIALGLMGIVLGLYWMARGRAGYAAVRSLQTDPRRIRILSVVSAVVLLSLIGGLKLWLSFQGYS